MNSILLFKSVIILHFIYKNKNKNKNAYTQWPQA